MSEYLPYLTLKLARELYQKPPAKLEPDERQRVEQVVSRQLKIEQRILSTPEAAQIVLPPSSLQQALAEIRGRYANEEDYRADLDKSGLDPAGLQAAIERDLTFDAVLDRVASLSVDVSETDVEIFYFMHRERFRRPENRTMRHILVTINESVPGNDRVSARYKIDTIRERVLKSPKRFAEQALKHSECPTALNGGLLGKLKTGQLYPELDQVAATLAAGEISGIVESPMGFHILYCISVEAAGDMDLAQVKDRIRSHLLESRRRACQKAWIASLFKQEAGAKA
jgi:peptidyl-prolyl cis-trans isomerase C